MFEDGLERKINDRQNQLLIDQEKKEVVQWKNLKQRYQSARIDVRKQREKLLNYQNEYLNNKNLNDLVFCIKFSFSFKLSFLIFFSISFLFLN